MNADNRDLDSLSEKVLSAVFEVSSTLGAGYLERFTSVRCFES